MAKDVGLKGISITDHDAVLPKEVIDAAQSMDFKLINAVEFSTAYHNVHILGYGLSFSNPELNDFVKTECEKRKTACQEMCKKTKEYNIPVSFEEVLAEKNNIEGVLGRPHIAAVMVKKKYVKNGYEAFQKYLRKGCPVYVGYDKYRPPEIVEKIKAWKGIPIIAHLGLVKVEPDKIFQECLEAGLLGIEVYYPRHSFDQVQRLLELTVKHNLLISGGSDFHGILKPDIELGDAGLTEENYLLLKAKLDEIKT